MNTLYGYTILVDLGLIAIIVAIFIFAVTIYRGASELSRKEKENASKRLKEVIENKKGKLTKKLKTISDSVSVNQVKKELVDLDNEIKDIDKSMIKVINRAKGLTAKYLVFIPGSLLLISILTTGIAIVISDIAQNILWSISLSLLIISVVFITRGISNINYFSNSIDLSTLMEQALDRHISKMRPSIKLEIWNPKLEIKHGEIITIHYDLHLEQGFIAKNAVVRFSGTEELDFPNEKITKCEYSYNNMNKPKQFFHKYDRVNPDEYEDGKFDVKTPEEPGKYTMAHWVLCDEFTSKEEIFTIIVT